MRQLSLSLLLLIAVVLLHIQSVNANGITNQKTGADNRQILSADKNQKTDDTKHPPSPDKFSEEPINQAVVTDSLPRSTQKYNSEGKTDGSSISWGSVADWVMACITLIAVTVALITLNAIKDQVKAGNMSAEAAMKTANHIVASERAYFRITHMSPPGLHTDRPLADHLYASDAPQTWELKMKVINIGKTPGRITGLGVGHVILDNKDALPSVPPYNLEKVQDMDTLLHSNEMFAPYVLSFQVGSSIADEIHCGRKILCVVVFVDYMDHFQQRYKAGYARFFNPGNTENNLSVVPNYGYNYDRARHPGEGHDWIYQT